MQLDNTLIVVRSRSNAELIDLAIVVLRNDFFNILFWSFVGWIPFLFIDALALSPIVMTDRYSAESTFFLSDSDVLNRVVWHIVAMFILQAPAASLPLCNYIGQRMFRQEISLSMMRQNYFSGLAMKLYALVVKRGILAGLVVTILAGWTTNFSFFLEVFLLAVCIILPVLIARATRPFAPEILTLERQSVQSEIKNSRSQIRSYYAKRMKLLHTPIASQMFGRFIVMSGLSAALVCLLTMAQMWMFQVFSNWSNWGWLVVLLLLPVSLFFTSTYVAIYRFLSYIDSRILLEGWEVRLRFMSEASRLRVD